MEDWRKLSHNYHKHSSLTILLDTQYLYIRINKQLLHFYINTMSEAHTSRSRKKEYSEGNFCYFCIKTFLGTHMNYTIITLRWAFANSVDPDSVASDQGLYCLYCLLYIQQYFIHQRVVEWTISNFRTHIVTT